MNLNFLALAYHSLLALTLMLVLISLAPLILFPEGILTVSLTFPPCVVLSFLLLTVFSLKNTTFLVAIS